MSTERRGERSVRPAEDHSKRRAGSRVWGIGTVGNKTGGMSGGTRRWARDWTTSGGEEEKGDVVYVVSMFVHEIEDVLLELRVDWGE